MSDPMITLTTENGDSFYVNAFVVDMIEPVPHYYMADGGTKTIVHVGELQRRCRELPDEVKAVVDQARADVQVNSAPVSFGPDGSAVVA